MSAEAVLKGKTLPSKEFCDVLVNEVKNGHARLYHPFYLDLYNGKLPLEAIKIWAKEAWGIFACNVAINTAKLVRCQLSGIHDPEIHKKFVDIIHSEVGYTYFEGSPRPVLARVGWLDIALRSNHILEQVAATNCCNELSNQLTGGKFFRAFRDHYGLKPHDIEFFAEHGEADTEHSNIGYELVEQFATTNELQVRVLKALRKGLAIWWALTDGVAREAAKLRK